MAVGEARSTRSGRGEAVRFDASRFHLITPHDDVAILELEGRFHAGARRSVGRPRLVVRSGDASAEAKAVEAQSAYAGPDPRPWRAAFAVPRALAEAGDATFALAVGKSLVLDLPAPDRDRPTKPQDEVEGQTWGSMVVDLSEARRELEEAQDELARANEELARLREVAEQPADDEPAEERPRVTWLEEVEAEATANTNGAGPEAGDDAGEDETDDEEDDGAPLPVLAGRRRITPPTMEHDAVYEATLKRVQVERRARLRRRRVLGRLLALVFFLAAAAAIYAVVDGDIGVDILKLL